MDLKRKFVSEDELDEKRQKRQEEWDKVRKPEDPIEVPEEEYDPRSLYDRLQEQKQMKQDEFDEQHRLKNQIRGLDEGETQFLDFVGNMQTEIDQQRQKEEKELLEEYKASVVTRASEDKPGPSRPPGGSKSLPTNQPNQKSQAAILAGIVRKKQPQRSAGETQPCHEAKAASEPTLSQAVPKSEVTPASEQMPPGEAGLSADQSNENSEGQQLILPSAMRVIGILPGMKDYSDSSDEGSSSSSDAEESVSTLSKGIKVKIPGLGTGEICKSDLKALRNAMQQ